MVKRLYYSLVHGKGCPYCGHKWMLTKARRSMIKLYGRFEMKCRCGREWTVIVKEDGYEYIEK